MQYHLFFSEKCKNSEFFLSQLDNNKEKSTMIQRHSIHTPGIKLPRSIVAVPHLIVIDDRGTQYDFVGDDLARWWVHQTTGKEPDRRAAPQPTFGSPKGPVAGGPKGPMAGGPKVGPKGLPKVGPESSGGAIAFGEMDFDPLGSANYSMLDDPDNTTRNPYESAFNETMMAPPQPRAADNYSKEQKRNEFDERMKQLEESRKMF